jgi:hypothetical protein
VVLLDRLPPLPERVREREQIVPVSGYLSPPLL